MTKEPIMIDCEYCMVLGNENKCKALQIETHTCLGITAKNKCPIYKLKQQLQSKEQEYNRLSNLITSTKAYEITCSNCRDAILTAPTISGRTKFSQIEVEESSLKMIIEQLDLLKEENEKMEKGYVELTEIVSPYIDDFTGYNEELGGFDIVLCVKQLMEQLEAYKMEAEEGKEINAELKAENEELKETISDKEKWLSEIEIKNSEYWKEKYADLHIRYGNRIEELKQALQEIKEIAENDCKTCTVKLLGEDEINCKRCYKTKILQKCEVIKNEKH